MRLTAVFASTPELNEETAQAFVRMSGVFLVWPYARATLTSLSQMAGVPAPYLPLLSRPGRLVVEPGAGKT